MEDNCISLIEALMYYEFRYFVRLIKSGYIFWSVLVCKSSIILNFKAPRVKLNHSEEVSNYFNGNVLHIFSL